MTVTSIVRKNTYPGVDTVGPFPYTFQVFVAEHLVVTLVDIDGVTETPLVPGADYTATDIGDPDGGEVTLTNALATGYALILERSVPYLQETTNLLNQGPFYPDTIEKALDYARMVDLQLLAGMARLQEITATIQGDILTIEGDISGIEGDIDAINIAIGAINSAISIINNRLDSIEGRLDAIEARLDAIEARLDVVEGQIIDILGRLDAIEASMLTNPMTHAGDMIMGGVDGAPLRLPYRPTIEGPKFLIIRNEQPEWAQLVFEEYASVGTPGDLIYATAPDGIWARLPIGNELDVLTITDGIPSWEPPA